MKSKADLFVIQKIKQRRIEKKMSQADLAFELNVSVGFIGKVESPKYATHYNINHVNTIAKILKCSSKDFFPEEPL